MRSIEISFPKLNHFWLDSGLLGLAVILEEINFNIMKKIDDDGLTLIGTEKDILNVLEKAYEVLLEQYYNTSTKKQIDDLYSYNFYYDTKKDDFVIFPKKKSVGIAKLIFNKAPRPTGSSVRWEKKEKREILINDKIVNKNRGILPFSYTHLQKRMDFFLDKHGLDVTTSGLLVDGPNKVQPKVKMSKIFINSIDEKCYFCGEDSFSLEETGQTIFPFITGSSGLLNFNSSCGKPAKVCWKCAFIGKFVPVNGFYISQGDSLFAFFPYSISFEKMLDVYTTIQDAKYEDPNLSKNFQHPLGFENYQDGYFQKPFEITFAFLYTLYRKVLLQQKTNGEIRLLNWEKMCNLTVSKYPLEFVVLHAESKGQTSMGKMVWSFRDSVYFFRLMEVMEKSNINIKEVMRLFIDFSQKNQLNKTIIRNNFCERILKKETILDIIEKRVWDLVFPKDERKTKPSNPSPVVDFLFKYENIIQEGNMTDEERNVAVSLGKSIGLCVSKKDNDIRSRNEIERDIKRLRGDLIKLRKVRKITDFLSELERLQVKYDFSLRIPDGFFEGKLREDNFKEFKGFCNVDAMQSYYKARFHALKEKE